MTLAKAISEASAHEIKALAAYVAGEVALEGALSEGETPKIDAEAIDAAMRAWAFMQTHARDGEA